AAADSAATGSVAMASPQRVVQSLAREVPGFTPLTLAYGQGRDGKPSLRVQGSDPRYGLRGPNFTLAILDPATGAVTGADYLGGRQDGWGATLTAFFTLHFGSFGGAPVRWAYFLLGLSGAVIFYTGNLLWVESRRRRERKAGAVEQTRATCILGALTVGVPLGSIAGVAVTLAAAKPLGTAATPGLHSAIYHAVFFAFVGWALLRGSARGAIELLPGAALAMLAIPAMSLACAGFHPERVRAVDGVALILAGLLGWAWKATLRRARSGPRDSVWSALPAGQSGGEAPRPAL
ncbi:PepSY domain-containing protein, partial [Novosphingobium sp. 1949]